MGASIIFTLRKGMPVLFIFFPKSDLNALSATEVCIIRLKKLL